MLLDDLHEKKRLIEEMATLYGARRIRVFGSVARREERADSDIDFLVDFPSGYDLFSQRLPLERKLSELTGRKVEVIPEHEVNRHFYHSIIEESQFL
jgi:uncharacterized protein